MIVHRSPSTPAPPSGGGRELRTATRVTCDLPVTVDGEDLRGQSRMVDLSTGGTAIISPRPPTLGDVYAIRFELDDTEVRCAGLVRSWRPQGDKLLVGLEFHQLKPDDRKRIGEWVRRRIQGGVELPKRERWSSAADLGVARPVDADERQRLALRWSPGMVALWEEVAKHLLARDSIFVPVPTEGHSEGERLFLEIVVPQTHIILRFQAEVSWVQPPAAPDPGLGLRLGGLSSADRGLIEAINEYFRREAERFR